MITAEEFEKHVGHPPQDDDLDRCNCEQANMPGHRMCGWDYEANLPVYMTGNREATVWPSPKETS